MKARLMILGLAVILALPGGRAVAQDGSAPIELRRADVLRTEQGASGPVRYLDGNVWITQDTLSVTSDHAVYEEAEGRLTFTGNVHFQEPTRQFWAEQVVYFEDDGRAIGDGGVRIEQDSLIVTADKVIYHEDREQASFHGGVRLRSLKENAILTGDYGTYDRREERGIMTRDPRLVRYFSDTDSMLVEGEVIEYQFDQRTASVRDSVYLQRNDFDAWGQKLFYWEDENRARLTGDPLLKRGFDTLKADTVDAYFEEQKLRRVLLAGQAIAASPVDSLVPEPKNVMTGHRMEIVFRESRIDSIYVNGNATSLYYVREEEQGANRVSGDVINMALEDGRIGWIYVEGGTEGTYYPQPYESLVRSADEAVPEPRPYRGSRP